MRILSRPVGLILLVLVAAWAPAQGNKFTIKTGPAPAPKEIHESIGKLLAPQSTQLLDEQGKTVCEVWFRQEVPADATPEQIKNGLTYREVKQSEVLGAIRFERDWTDYRKQKVKAGVYTLRLGFQPVDGDHAGSSEFADFCLVVAADKDTKPALMEGKQLYEISMKSIGGGHPGVFMLFPNPKPGPAPELAAKPKNHWVLNTKESISVKGKKNVTQLGFGLNLVGHAE